MLSLAELASVSGVSSRTIRYYQAQNLLPRPAKRGRDAVYGAEHVERLTLIGELRDRGMSLQTIRELVSTENPAGTVSEWLGVDATLSAPWSDDRPRTLTRTELLARIDEHGDGRPGLIGELEQAGFVEPRGEGLLFVPSPALLTHALRLRRAGIDIEIAARVRDLLRRRLSKAVDDTVDLLVARSGAGFAGGGSPGELATALGALRPVTREMSGVILAHEVERALAVLVERGPRRLAQGRRR